MKPGFSRFQFYLQQFSSLLSSAAKQKNPALWLYQHNARTPLFMLEGLCKLYSHLHNTKKFEKLKARFKLLEDALGAIDYYDAYAKELAANKKIPTSCISYLKAQTREKVQYLNELLVEEGWLGADADRLMKVEAKLVKADWLKASKEVAALEEFYGEAIYDIKAFLLTDAYHFDNVEADVHELRRKLRWLSIYPQALQGAIQLTQSASTPAVCKPYLVPAITESPFNKLPAVGTNSYVLLLNEPYFMALSWIILTLGNLKDQGLKVVVLKEALQQTDTLSDKAADKKVYQLLGKAQPTLEAILLTASDTCKKWFGEQHLEHLVAGSAGITASK